MTDTSLADITATSDTHPIAHVLRGALGQAVTLPGSTGWDAARLAWNLAVDQHPLAVVTVRDVEQIATTIRLAAEHGVPVLPQPRGHGAFPTLADGAVLLRTGALDQVVVDPARRILRVGAGVRWGEALAALRGTGLVALAGSSPDVSVAGYLVNGGLSWFSREHGLAAHAVRAMEVVDASGTLRRVDRDGDADLWWALRGGGGGLGVVTALELDLFAAPALHGGKIVLPATDGPAVLRRFAAVTADAPRRLSVWASLLHLPDVPQVPEPMRGGSFTVIDWVTTSLDDDVVDRLASLRSLGTVLRDTSGPLDVSELGSVAAEPLDPTPGTGAVVPLRRFSDADVEAFLGQVGAGSGTPLTSIMVRHVGGALGDAEPFPGAHGPVGSLTDPYLLFALGTPGRGNGPALARALRSLVSAMAPASSGGRIVPSFLGGGPATAAYSPEALRRLVSIRQTLDPRGTIRPSRPLDG